MSHFFQTDKKINTERLEVFSDLGEKKVSLGYGGREHLRELPNLLQV